MRRSVTFNIPRIFGKIVTRIYFRSMPVDSQRLAETVSSSLAWEIIEELRDAGPNGLTLDQISDILDENYTTVQNIVSKLKASRLVEVIKQKRIGRPTREESENSQRLSSSARGRKKQVFVENIPWGGNGREPYLQADFKEVVDDIIDEVLKTDEYRDTFSKLINEILMRLSKNRTGKRYLPGKEICRACKTNHEANEFIWAAALMVIYNLLYDEKFNSEILEILPKYDVILDNKLPAHAIRNPEDYR